MYKKSKTKISLILISIVFVFLNLVSLESLYAAGTPNPYEKQDQTLDQLAELYNKRVNEHFNAKLELLTQGDKGQGISKIPQGDDCEEKNYTTFCTAVAAAKEFTQYSEALQKRKQVIPTTTDVLTEVALKGISQAVRIDNDINRSKKALDTALESYNELRLAYPVHLQYQEVIKNLTKYNKKMSQWRQQVEKLPPKFIDATTTQCT